MAWHLFILFFEGQLWNMETVKNPLHAYVITEALHQTLRA